MTATTGGLVASGMMLPKKWKRPVIERVILPAHADTTQPPPSDRRLKSSITEVTRIAGIRFYKWEWNETATRLFGLSGEGRGVIAQELAGILPDLVKSSRGILRVDYRGLLRHLVR